VRAIVYHRYGGPENLELREIERPSPTESEVLVRVRAASVNPVDWHLMRGQPALARVIFGGILRPKQHRLGRDLAGVVEAVAPAVTAFKPGDEVFGAAPGSFAEFVIATEDLLERKPANVTFEEAAAVPIAGITALQALRDLANVQSGQRLVVNGASGGVGSFAVQIAKAWGATVTGVTSARNVERVRSIGADDVVDYTQKDFVVGGQRYDVVFDNVGNRSEAELGRITVPGGVVVLNGGAGNTAQIVLGMIATAVRSRRSAVSFKSFIARPNRGDLTVLAALMAGGQVKPLIDCSYPLAEIRDAVRYLETLHARGKVVISI
jgi:NADPH:quinone reductase-like Zn-dependent oxidoreductase